MEKLKIKMPILQKTHRGIFLFFALVSSLISNAQEEAKSAYDSIDYTLAYVMLIVVVLFVFVIWALTKILENVSDHYAENWKDQVKKESSRKAKAGMIALPFLLAYSAKASGTIPLEVGLTAGIPTLLFNVLVVMILFEFVIILILTAQIFKFLNKRPSAWGEESVAEGAQNAVSSKLSWWDKFNEFKPMSKEADIDLGHDYDGIRELDNKLPPWWLYGFYFTIIFGVIYFYRFNISHTGLSSAQEYERSVEIANKSKEAFLKKSGNKVDENTVTLLTDPALLSKGEANFQQLCAVCHGKKGEGLVGPNLTDNYWIYGGSIKDVFKTIKYGTNKGMQSWKENLSAEKIAQVASYVKSLGGTKVENGKAPEGELYQEPVESTEVQETTSDSTVTK